MSEFGTVHKVSLEQLMRISYCGMQSYLMDQVGFPYWATTSSIAWGKVFRASVQTFFYNELIGVGNGLDTALASIKTWDRIIKERLPQEELSHLKFRSETVLALNSLRKIYDPSLDTVLGVNLPITYNYELDGDQFQISDSLDVLYYANDKRYHGRKARVLVIDDPASPLAGTKKLVGVRLGLIYEFLRKQVEVPRRTFIEVLYLPMVNTKWIPVNRTYVRESELFLEETLRVWPFYSRMPTTDEKKCRSCCYADVCKIDLLNEDKEYLKEAFQSSREAGRGKPFYKEQPWRINENLTLDL